MQAIGDVSAQRLQAATWYRSISETGIHWELRCRRKGSRETKDNLTAEISFLARKMASNMVTCRGLESSTIRQE